MEYKVSLTAARINSDLTQNDVAKSLNVSTRTVCNWETGRTAIPATALVKLCKLYKVPLDNISLP